MTKLLGRLAGFFMVALLCGGLFVGVAYAESLQSSHYRFDESTVGSGGLIQSNSANFQSSSSIGDTAVGNSKSDNFQVEAGSKTTPDPTLSFGVTSPNATFGNFSATTTATATATFTVSNYTSYGYAVQIVGSPPKNGNHTITAMGTTGTSQTGIEQFGINMVANTSPANFGANPDQGQFGAGVAADDYKVANHFRYVEGETIATAPKTSGVTTFTISYIVNVAPLTPGGQYTSQQSVVCTGTF
jgi:hypothetical protein